jgi:hypothetical protein
VEDILKSIFEDTGQALGREFGFPQNDDCAGARLAGRESMKDGERLMMRCGSPVIWTSVVLALLLGCGGSTAPVDDAAWSPPALSGEATDLPEGREVIRRAIDFMNSHDRFGFEAMATYEVVQKTGQKIHFDMLQRVAIEQPTRLYWVTLNDDATSDTAWLKDGTFTMVRQPANVWGQVAVPSTLTAAVSMIAREYDIPVPFVDLLSGDVSDLWLGEGVQRVDYIGEAWINGLWTDHVALRRADVDVELWFRQGDQPFPVKMVVIRTAEDGFPMFSARFSEWSTVIADGAIPEFVPPEGSEKLEIVPIVRP